MLSFGAVTFMVSKEPAKVTSWTAYPSIDYGKSDSSVMTGFSGVTVYDMRDDGTWKKITPRVKKMAAAANIDSSFPALMYLSR